MCEPQTGLQSQWNVNTSVLTERVCFPLEAFRIHLWFLIKLVTELITCYAWFRFNYHFLHKNVSVFIFSRRAKSDYNKMTKIWGYKLDLMLYFQDISENIIIILNMHWFIELWGEYPGPWTGTEILLGFVRLAGFQPESLRTRINMNYFLNYQH